VVTGGTRGIGIAIAEQLHQAGVAVTVTGTKEKNQTQIFEHFQYYKVNFLDQAEVEPFVKVLSEKKPDILINNAGINEVGEFANYKLEAFKNIQKVNLEVPFQLCQAVLPGMKEKGWGRIINVSSIYGLVSKEYRAAYSASKFGLDGLTAALAAEVARYGILANCVAPGFIETDLTRSVLGEQGMKEISTRIPMGRLGKPEEIAAFVTWLVSPLNTYISGQNLAIDGGFTRV